MDKTHSPDLKIFAREAFEALGSVIQDLDADTFEILIPDEWIPHFNGQDYPPMPRPAQAFEGIYTQAPSWYAGNWTTFSPRRFGYDLQDATGSMCQAFRSQPRSTGSSSSWGGSGFGGGGFSGGGGGGGGGGSW